MTTETAHHEAHSEKQHAAPFVFLFWALFLTLIELGAGLDHNEPRYPFPKPTAQQP